MIFMSFLEEEMLKKANPLPLNSPLILKIQLLVLGFLEIRSAK